MTDVDIVSRTAMVVARAVHRRPDGCTYAYARTSLRAADRHLFLEALASAVAVAMVRVVDGKLYPGGRSPDPWGEDGPPHCRTCTCDDEPKRCRFKSSTSCRVCRRWLEGEWNRAAPDSQERTEIQRQMDAGHCDSCHEKGCGS